MFMPNPSSPTSAPVRPRVKTPCIGVCSTGIGDAVCRGCKRFAHEVIDWNAYSEEEKRIVDSRLAGFLSLCMRNRFEVTDPGLLRWQLETQQIRFRAEHDEYCGLFSLLKAGASQIKEPERYGFSVLVACPESGLRELMEQVDREFWELSVAHHERYLATPDLFCS